MFEYAKKQEHACSQNKSSSTVNNLTWAFFTPIEIAHTHTCIYIYVYKYMQMHDTYIKRSTENQDNGEKRSTNQCLTHGNKTVNTEDEIVHT